MKLVISLATRGRPQQVVETISRSIQNLVLPNTVMMVQLDADDESTINALSLPPWTDKRVQINTAVREDTIAAKWNRALSIPADVYLVAADDDPYITPGYDAKILEAATLFPDGIGMVYGHMANASFSGAVAPTAKFVQKLGYIFPPYFPYWFVDHWTDDIAKIIGRISFADIRTDQSRVGKTQEVREPAWWSLFFDAAYLMRRSIAHAIINSTEFDEPAWRKKMLLAHHPMIEYRSRWINDSVRAQAKVIEQWSGLDTNNPRYQRVRKAAELMVHHLLDDYGMNRAEAAKFRNVLTPPTEVVGLKQAFA